jgi:hypothetical protein
MTNTKYYQRSWSNGFAKNRIEISGNILYCIQKGDKKIESWREYSPSGMVMTVSCEGITAKKYFIADGQNDDCNDWNGCCVHTSSKVNLV